MGVRSVGGWSHGSVGHGKVESIQSVSSRRGRVVKKVADSTHAANFITVFLGL